MRRWNIATIFFLGTRGQRRDVRLEPDAVNIITGASGTGKSTLIKAIDYCLGSSKCELPAHVRRRSLAVGVKWTDGDSEFIVGRIIPPVGQATSTRMFVSSGRDLALPDSIDAFQGATTVASAKSFIEQAFGIGDVRSESDETGDVRGRATVRHVTPYIFVTKEVIYSETVLLHGLEVSDKARDIIETLPYFLRASDEATAVDERRLRQLQRALEREEAHARSRATIVSALRRRATNLLDESHRIGLIRSLQPDLTEDELVTELKSVLCTTPDVCSYPNESELSNLHASRRDVLDALGVARRKLQATRAAIREASGFQSAVGRQREKLEFAQHLHLDEIPGRCPLCDAPSERGRTVALALQETLAKVRNESAAVERVKPKLIEHDREIEVEVETLNAKLRRIDDQIRSWLGQNEETKRIANLAQLQAHLLGRISFFLESVTEEPRDSGPDINVIRSEIDMLRARVDREAKAIKLRRAEAKISQYASEAFLSLPTVAPCVGAELEFSSRQPELTVIEANDGAVLRMPDVGSDQNYLAVHIALSFALQHFFEVSKSPVPGLLVLDQISRPYFPSNGEHEKEDETEVAGGEEDEDIRAMRKHIDFVFRETERRNGLQVLLIEHAYFADDPRYVAATRERWTRVSGRGLIPADWPTRADDQGPSQ